MKSLVEAEKPVVVPEKSTLSDKIDNAVKAGMGYMKKTEIAQKLKPKGADQLAQLDNGG